MGVRAGRLVVVGTLTGLVGVYGAFSTFIVFRSLATRQVCPPASAAPAGITAEQVFYRSLSDGARMAAWFAPSSSGRAVIVVHGIDGYAGVGADTEIARAYQTGGFALLMPDLRAHGASEGTRLSLGALERGDIRGAVDFLLGRGIGPGRIGIHGTSYGAAMALLALAETTRTTMFDPVLLVGGPALLVALALMACYLPARRSTRIDPTTALRSE